jgi:hypothetical protein
MLGSRHLASATGGLGFQRQTMQREASSPRFSSRLSLEVADCDFDVFFVPFPTLLEALGNGVFALIMVLLRS